MFVCVEKEVVDSLSPSSVVVGEGREIGEVGWRAGSSGLVGG